MKVSRIWKMVPVLIHKNKIHRGDQMLIAKKRKHVMLPFKISSVRLLEAGLAISLIFQP
jgi:hypothetical protein